MWKMNVHQENTRPDSRGDAIIVHYSEVKNIQNESRVSDKYEARIYKEIYILSLIIRPK